MAIIEIKVDEVFIRKMDEYRQPDKNVKLVEAASKNIIVFAERMLGLTPPGMVLPEYKKAMGKKVGHIYSWQVYALTLIQRAIENRYNRQISVTPFGDTEYSGGLIVKVDSREFTILTSRQIGKSTLLGIIGNWTCVFNKVPCGATDSTSVILVSASDVQAKTLLYEMKKQLIMGDAFMRDTYLDAENKPVFGDKFFSNLLSDEEPNNTTTITFKQYNEKTHGKFLLAGSRFGSTIQSYPPTSVVLGKTASIVMEDEAGMTDRITDQFHYDYLYPTGNSTDAVRIYTSTPWISSGFFYRMVDPDEMYGNTDAVVITFTIDAIRLENPNYYETVMKTVKQLNADGKKDEIQRAYYCRFIKGESAYFNPDDVFPCFKDYAMLDKYPSLCDMGIDYGGQVKSRTVVTITEYTSEGIVRRLFHQVYPVGKDLDLLADIADLRKRFNIQRIVVDDCAAGAVFNLQMEQKGWEIQRMSFRAEKIKKYGAFRMFLQKHKIISYTDDALKTEMLAMEHTPGNRQSNIQHAPGYSDDLIDSFVMSSYFFIEDEDKVEFFGWNKPRESIIPKRRYFG